MEVTMEQPTVVPRKSLAQIRFPVESRTIPYFIVCVSFVLAHGILPW